MGLNAQTTLNGRVTDEAGEALIGANIYLKDTYDGASSEGEGRFVFESYESGWQLLAVSMLGYQTLELPVELKGGELPLGELKLRAAANELEAVVITAGAFEAGDAKKTTVLNSLDIVTTAGALADIASAMNTLPGAQRVGESGQLFVRGGAAGETRAFIDGMYVQNPFSSTAPNLPARGRFSPFLFKGMLFSTGGYSAEYGQALSSALILNSVDLAPETVTGVSLMTVGGGLSHTHRWENHSVAATFDYSNLGPYLRLAPQFLRWEQAPQTLSGQLMGRHKTSATGMVKWQAQGSRSAFAVESPLPEEVTRSEIFHLQNDYVFASASYREVLGDRWTVFGGIGYSYNCDTLSQRFNLRTRAHALQGKAVVQYAPVAALSLKTGLEWLGQTYRERYADPEGTDYQNRLPERYSAWFTEAEWTLDAKTAARGGLRIEHSRLLGAWNAAPRLSVARKTGAHSQVAMAWGRFFQTPAFGQLRYGADLDFERADHYVLNYQYERNRRIFRVEGYHKPYRALVSHPANEPWLADNSGRGYARGLDVFFRDSKSVKYADFWVSYSFLDTERLYLDFPEASRPGFASAHNVSVVGKRWFPALTSTIGFTYAFASRRWYDDPNTPAFNDGRSKPYHDLSLNASYLTHLGRHFTIVHLSVSNVLGLYQEFGYRFSTAPGPDGRFSSVAIRPTAPRFFFIGLFVSIGRQVKITPDEALDQ